MATDGDAFRVWLAQQGIEAVIPARKGHEPQPHDPKRYQTRNAVERGLGWLKWWRRVATRYDQYAHRFLGFLYLSEILPQHDLKRRMGMLIPSGFLPP